MITDIKDRVPLEPGRRLVEPENGGAPFYAKITRADNAIEPGSPLNRALLEEIGTMQAEAVNNNGVIEITAASGASRIVFTAPSDFSDADTYTLNGSELTLKQTNGQALSTAWVEGAPVELTIVGAVGFFKGGGAGRKRRGEIEVQGRALMDINLDDAVVWQQTGSWETGASAVPAGNLPGGNATHVAVDMTKDGKFLIAARNTGGFKTNGTTVIIVYKRDDNDPDNYSNYYKTIVNQTTWGITDLKLSSDETMVITTHYHLNSAAPAVVLWSFNNQTGDMAELSSAISGITWASGNVAWAAAWHPNSQEACISYSTGTGTTASIYDVTAVISISGNTMTQQQNLIYNTANSLNRVYDLDYSPDGLFVASAKYISNSLTAGNRVYLFKSTGVQHRYSDATSSLPDNPQIGTYFAVKFNPNNVDLALISYYSTDGNCIWTRSGDTFTKRPDPSPFIPVGYDVDFDPSGLYLVTAYPSPGYPSVFYIPPDPKLPPEKMPGVVPNITIAQYAVRVLRDRFVLGTGYNAASPFGPLMMYTTETQEILQPWRNLGMTHKWLPTSGYGGFADQNIPAHTIGKATVYEQFRG